MEYITPQINVQVPQMFKPVWTASATQDRLILRQVLSAQLKQESSEGGSCQALCR